MSRDTCYVTKRYRDTFLHYVARMHGDHGNPLTFVTKMKISLKCTQSPFFISPSFNKNNNNNIHSACIYFGYTFTKNKVI